MPSWCNCETPFYKDRTLQCHTQTKSIAFQDFFDSPASLGVRAVGALGIGMLGMAMMLPNLQFQISGEAPTIGVGGSVGSPGGGALPNNFANPTLPLSLALVPLGLVAVAVFPPFTRFVDWNL